MPLITCANAIDPRVSGVESGITGENGRLSRHVLARTNVCSMIAALILSPSVRSSLRAAGESAR